MGFGTHPTKHSLVVEICEKLRTAIKGTGTTELDVWRQLELMNRYALTDYVKEEFKKNHGSEGLWQWLYDDFSGTEWQWTKFMFEALDSTADSHELDGIPKDKSYYNALPIKHEPEVQSSMLPSGNTEYLTVNWALSSFMKRVPDPNQTIHNYDPPLPPLTTAAYRYNTYSPRDKKNITKTIDRGDAYMMCRFIKDGDPSKGDTGDKVIRLVKRDTGSQKGGFNGNSVYASIDMKWNIIWATVPGIKFKIQNSAGNVSNITYPPLKGWMLINGESDIFEAAENEKSKDPDTGKWTVKSYGGFQSLWNLINEDRIRGRQLAPGFGGLRRVKVPLRWKMLEGDINGPSGIPVVRSIATGNFDWPGTITKRQWTNIDTRKAVEGGNSSREHLLAYEAAQTCWNYIFNNNPKKLLKIITGLYSLCYKYPQIIERFHLCYYYYNPLTRFVGDENQVGKFWIDFSRGNTGLDRDIIHKLGGFDRKSVRHSSSDLKEDKPLRHSLREALELGSLAHQGSENYDSSAWAACEKIATYCGEITWEEIISNGDKITVGPIKVWGHPTHQSGAWEITKGDKNLKIVNSANTMGPAGPHGDINPFEVEEYKLDRDARVAFGFGWKCEKKPKEIPLPVAEPPDIQPQEPPPEFQQGNSVPAYDNVTMNWLDGAYLVTSMVTDLKGVSSPFKNHGSMGAHDTGSGVNELNESSRNAKASANPSQNLAKSHINAASGNTLSMNSAQAPASMGGGSIPDYNDKVDGIMNDLKSTLGDNNLTKLAGLLADLAKRFPHLQDLIMSALEAMLRGQFGLLLSVCKQILAMNIDDPLMVQIKALCNSNVTDFYNTPGVPGEAPSSAGNIKRGLAVMAEAQLAANEFILTDEDTGECIIT